MRGGPAPPPLFSRRVKARSLAFLFTAGAAVGCLTLLFPHGDTNDGQLLLLAAAAVVVSAIVFVRAETVAEWQLHVALAIGTLILTLAIGVVNVNASYSIIYTWTALYAFYFFSTRAALAHLALMGAAFGLVLALNDVDSAVVRWILTVGTPAVAGLLIQRLLNRLADEARRTRESDTRTRGILESAQDAFVATDRDGRIVGWNTASERLFGWSQHEVLGRDLVELLVAPEEREAHRERRNQLLRTDRRVADLRHELELVRQDGTRFPAEKAITRVGLHEDTVMASFIRDLSDQRRRDEERLELYREQAARAEAERVAEMVAGMQLLVDAALAHNKLDDMLRDLLPRVRGVLEADEATVLLAEEDGALVVRGSTAPLPPGEPVRIPFGEGFAGAAAAQRRPLLVRDPPADDPSLPGAVTSAIGVPLLAGGAVTGVIQVTTSGARRFRDEDLGVLRLAADRVALAIDHARVFEREHQIAETLQRSLLPERLPNLPGLAAAARYLPAASEAEVGGDWYDVIPIPGGSVGLVMGDVAGKGLQAASMVGRLRSALRAYALEGHDPKTVVERLNRLVWTELEESQMATLVYAAFDPVESVLAWVNAGHPPPLVSNGPDDVGLLRGRRSVPLGVMPFPTFEADTVTIPQGATVLLYTDGLVERPGAHLDEGLQLLVDAVRDSAGGPDELCDHVVRRLVPRGATSDDVAVLALRNTPVSERFNVELPSEPESLASMRSLLRRWLKGADTSESEIAEITMACGEACTNAIEHAGGGAGAQFEVDGQLGNGAVDLVVRDSGSWRPTREDDQGRGLTLMDALMDEVEVTPSADGTVVRMRRALGNGS
jgi:PAS domain S-box-containing protein